MADKTFVRITNKDIFDKLELLIKLNNVEHGEIIQHQIRTNGKVKLNRWIATTALSFAIIIMGFISQSHF